MLKRSNHRAKQQSVQNILGPISESAKPFRNSVNMSQFSIEIYWALFGVRLRCLDILGPQLWADTSACSHFETRPKSFLGSFQHYGLSLPVHSSHVQHLNKWNYFCIAGMPEGQERILIATKHLNLTTFQTISSEVREMYARCRPCPWETPLVDVLEAAWHELCKSTNSTWTQRDKYNIATKIVKTYNIYDHQSINEYE